MNLMLVVSLTDLVLVLVISLTILMILLASVSVSYTPGASFSEKFLLHS